LKELISAANAFAKKYTSVDVTVISAFERHHAVAAATDAGTHAALETLQGLRSWHELEGAIDPGLWQLATELTGGDLLDWIADRPVDEMRRRAAELANLENPAEHPVLHRLVDLINRQFGLRPLFTELANVKTVADLKAQAGKRLDGLVQRLLGDDIKRLQETDLGHALVRIHAVLDRIDSFERAAYSRITDAARQAFLFDLHAEYSRATDNEALIDALIDATRPAGVELLRAAAHGDCRALLESLPSEHVRLSRGRLTHRLTRTRTVGVNIVGWHAGWRYRGMERAILRADQQIADAGGGVTVHTTVDLTRDKDRRRAQERVATNFMMRFIGESHGAVQPDSDTLEYLIDTLTNMAATYDLSFQDDSTNLSELGYYLGFARDFGLAESVRTDAVAALLPLKGPDDFGPMTVTYEVRYQSAGLRKLFAQPLDEAAIRRTIRKVTLASYVRAGGNLGRLGWAYWSSTTRKFFETSQTKSFASMSAKEFFVADSPFTGLPAPRYVVLQGTQLETLHTMYLIEDAFVRGLVALEALIDSGRKASPRELEDRLGDIATALRLLDSFGESVNTVFAVFDALLTEVRGADRASSLKIQSEAAGKTVTKVFLASSVS
jgi:hypothetical protein